MIVDRARNRTRILTLILLATLNYCIAAVIAATVTGVVIVIWILYRHPARDELEAILAYEITRVASWDVAMASWTAALTGRSLTAVAADETAIFGAPSRWMTLRLQAWALRGQGLTLERFGTLEGPERCQSQGSSVRRWTTSPTATVRSVPSSDRSTR